MGWGKRLAKAALRHAVVGVLTAGHGNIALLLNDMNDVNDCMDANDAYDAYDAQNAYEAQQTYMAQQHLQDVYDAQNAVIYADRGYHAYRGAVWFAFTFVTEF